MKILSWAGLALVLVLAPNANVSATDINPPKPLSDRDAASYKRIFALQEMGSWRKADREIARLSNRILMGHVEAQRYLHPTKYRSKYKELAAWLKTYADHPDARRIYKLALKRKPRRARAPRRPVYGNGYAGSPQAKRVYGTYYRLRKAGVGITRATRNFHRRVRSLVYRQRLTSAGKYVDRAERRGMHRAHIDIARARIAAGWFYYGNDKQTLTIAARAARRNGALAPFAWWYGGLAAFRSGDHLRAAENFEALATTTGISGATRAAAAFWAGRSNMIARRPARTSRYLRIAAEEHSDFYGILARRVLGMDSGKQWTDAGGAGGSGFGSLFGNPVTQRALALIQVNQRDRAERDLRQLAAGSDSDGQQALLAAADTLSMPGLAFRTVSAMTDRQSPVVSRALYPVPPWKPSGGFTVDRALVFAFMRQESAFRTRAKSRAGARGLMQLMPGTASYIGDRRYRGRARDKLFDPVLNITLGQKYLRYLLQHDAVGENLFLLAAAYNGGPGNLQKWKRKIGTDPDPLLLIESLPSRETRNFIERVLANLWIYRDRLGQDAPSLEALAAGGIPIYETLDSEQLAAGPR